MKLPPLPNKFSELIFVALDDLKWVEAQPETYQVFMPHWFLVKPYDFLIEEEKLRPDVCGVCLAGAVMAGSLKIPRDQETLQTMFGDIQSGVITEVNPVLIDDLNGEKFDNYEWTTGRKLSDLNAIRYFGRLCETRYYELQTDEAEKRKLEEIETEVPDYDEDRDGFYVAMNWLAIKLATIGH